MSLSGRCVRSCLRWLAALAVAAGTFQAVPWLQRAQISDFCNVTPAAAPLPVSSTALVTAPTTNDFAVPDAHFFGSGQVRVQGNGSPLEVLCDTTDDASSGDHSSTVALDRVGWTAPSDVLGLTVPSAPPPTPPPPGLGRVGMALPSDESAGASANDTCGNSSTISVATGTAAGKFGGALSPRGMNDRVTVVNAASPPIHKQHHNRMNAPVPVW